MSDNIIPKKFVGLHSHSLSIFDSIGSPKEHIDFALKNGMDALALTDHGHQTGFAEQFSYAQKLNKQGIKFKGLFGVEAYFIPSLKDWNNLYEETKKQKLIEKEKKKASKKEQELLDTDEKSIKEEMDSISEDKEESGAVIENEEESKSNNYKNPLYQRNHLVLLAKNSEGLKAIFRIISESNISGFYRYPRVDFDMLRKFSKGNIIATTACIAGFPAKIIADNQIQTDWKLWQPNNDNLELIQGKLKEAIENFKEALGEENYYLELQFNKLGYQHLVNYHLIEASKRTKTPLVITADAHYSNPDHWKEREIYKLLGYKSLNKESNKSAIPSKIEELKCELYPKNAEQIWQSYKETSKDYNFYDDQIICEATERTYDIAHNQIGKVEVDRRVKLPSIHKLVSKKNIEKFQGENNELDEDVVAFKELKELCIEGLKKKGKTTQQEYIDRLKMELDVIKHLKLAKYFLTTKKMLDIIRDKQIIGFGRGSGAGSLINYLLEITGVDSIKYDLLFQRFLNKKKVGMADVDNDVSNRDDALTLIKEYFGEENVIPISAFSQLQIASLIKDLAKLYGIPFEEVNEYTNKMRNEALAVAKQEPGFDAQQWVFTLDVAEKDSPSFKIFMEKVKDYPDFEKALKVLFKQPRQITRHAGGVLLTDNARDNMPLIRTNGEIQTPWADGLSGRNLEDYGFLKFDILGIGTLRMFEDCIRRILKKNGKQYVSFYDIKRYFNENLHPDINNFDDMKVYENVYWNKNYAGIFQFVKNNVQTFTAELKPTNIIDLAAITSVFRPGPLGADVDKLFLRNRKNPDDIEYIHPKLKELLKDTSGLIIFQEQAQLIFHVLAGFDLDETDKFRKLLNKKDLSKKEETTKELNDFKETFAQKCLEYSDLRIDKGRELFDIIKLYSSYSFNKCLHEDTQVETETGFKKIKDVEPGEKVNSQNGFIEVKNKFNQGKKKLFKIKTRNGKELVCTLDHKLETPLGMKTLKEIIELNLPILTKGD